MASFTKIILNQCACLGGTVLGQLFFLGPCFFSACLFIFFSSLLELFLKYLILLKIINELFDEYFQHVIEHTKKQHPNNSSRGSSMSNPDLQ